MPGGRLVGMMLASILLAVGVTPAGAEEPHPYHEQYQWAGFMACAVGTPTASAHVCAPLLGGSFLFEWPLSEGLQEVTLTLSWTPGSPVAERLRLVFENDDCNSLSCSYRYADVRGTSPITVTITDDDISEPAMKWSAINGSREVQVRVFPGDDLTVAVNQEFELVADMWYLVGGSHEHDD